MGSGKWMMASVVFLYIAGLALSLWEAFSAHYLLISIVLILTAIIPFYIRLERKAPSARELVLVASLAALAAASRIPFASLPSIKPTSFVVMISAMAFGPETGFLIGATAALVSNLFFGQGPWTPWQMFGWGMMGYTAGLLRHTVFLGKKLGMAVFGFIWGFLFGWLMNMNYLFGFMADVSFNSFVLAGAASFYFDLAHALSNVLFLTLFGTMWLRVLRRYQVKYHLY